MSDTPRTDAALDAEVGNPDSMAVLSLARQLERELAIKSAFLSSRQCPDHNGKWPRGRCLQCEIERLQKAAQSATADTARMDLIEKTCTYPWKDFGCWKFRVGKTTFSGETARAALDAALDRTAKS